jgi:hypothetical protein
MGDPEVIPLAIAAITLCVNRHNYRSGFDLSD